MNCIYCVTKSGKAVEGELDITERKNLLDQAKELGCQMVHIAARGEPTVDPLFKEQLQYINELGMIPVIFTHGANIDEEWAQLFWETNSSIMIKIHSFNNELQDFFAGKKGYAEKRNKGLKHLIEKGFNRGEPTRLGADILVMKKNYNEIESIFRWCRENNVFPLVKPFLCNNRGKSKYVIENLYVSPEAVKDLYERLSEIDKKEHGYFWEPTPPYAGINCNYYYYHIVVTIMGDIWPCIGLSHLTMGNIREKTLRECWESDTMDKIRNIHELLQGTCKGCSNSKDCYGCPCRRVYRKGPKKAFISESCWGDNV